MFYPPVDRSKDVKRIYSSTLSTSCELWRRAFESATSNEAKNVRHSGHYNITATFATRPSLLNHCRSLMRWSLQGMSLSTFAFTFLILFIITFTIYLILFIITFTMDFFSFSSPFSLLIFSHSLSPSLLIVSSDGYIRPHLRPLRPFPAQPLPAPPAPQLSASAPSAGVTGAEWPLRHRCRRPRRNGSTAPGYCVVERTCLTGWWNHEISPKYIASLYMPALWACMAWVEARWGGGRTQTI